MTVVGALSSVASVVMILYFIIQRLIFGTQMLGWSTVVILITFFSGLILVSLGIIGEYLWRIFDYVKHRPRYVVKEIIDETSDSNDKKAV